jgi:hypothetical protein
MKIQPSISAQRRKLGAVAMVAVLVSVLASITTTPTLAEEPADLIDPAVADLMVDKGLSVAEATRRIDWQERSDELSDAAESRFSPEQFGGVWIADDDRVTVGVTTTQLDAATSTVTGLAADVGLESAALNVVSVRHSLAELIKANDWLTARVVTANEGAESALNVGGYSTATNSVTLDIPAAPAVLTPAQQEVVEESRQELGDMLTIETRTGRVETNACSTQYCDVPLRAGVRFNITTGPSCTAGFIGHDLATGRQHVLTAGHCIRGHLGHPVTSRLSTGTTNQHIGLGRRWVFGSLGDAGVFDIANTGWKPRAWVYVTASSSSPAPGTVRNEAYPIRRDGVSVPGMRVCKRGYAGGTHCAGVHKVGAVVRYDDSGVTVGGLAVAGYCSQPGDSGGPVFANNTAYGIHSGWIEGTCNGYYQGVQGAEKLMNFKVAFDF